MNNVSQIKNCYGCGVCAAACLTHCVEIELNKSGFYEPKVNLSSCVDCGMCLKICSFTNKEKHYNTVISSYEAWSNNKEIRYKASSGGIGYELALMFLKRNYQVVVAKYDVLKETAIHYLAADEEELSESLGSKYIQSYTLDAFLKIHINKKTFVAGTPCQIASFRRWIRHRKVEDHFILMDFFCHGVPSALAWKNYLAIHEPETGKLLGASWRDKDTGWQDSWAMFLLGEKGSVHTRRSQGDLFYSIFLGGWCMNPACHKYCNYKYDKSAADIRIGDLWGRKYQHDEDGVSALVVFTEKGQDAVSSLNGCTIIPSSFDIVAEGQMKENAKAAWLSPFVMKRLKKGKHVSWRQWQLMNRMEFYIHIPLLTWAKFRKKLLR